jgi:acyl carrier protein
MFSIIKIKEILYTLITENTQKKYNLSIELYDERKENEALSYIISNSVLATSFVISIEDEFNIEIEDDELNLEFFSSIDKMTQTIKQHLNNKDNG